MFCFSSILHKRMWSKPRKYWKKLTCWHCDWLKIFKFFVQMELKFWKQWKRGLKVCARIQDSQQRSFFSWTTFFTIQSISVKNEHMLSLISLSFSTFSNLKTSNQLLSLHFCIKHRKAATLTNENNRHQSASHQRKNNSRFPSGIIYWTLAANMHPRQ